METTQQHMEEYHNPELPPLEEEYENSVEEEEIVAEPAETKKNIPDKPSHSDSELDEKLSESPSMKDAIAALRNGGYHEQADQIETLLTDFDKAVKVNKEIELQTRLLAAKIEDMEKSETPKSKEELYIVQDAKRIVNATKEKVSDFKDKLVNLKNTIVDKVNRFAKEVKLFGLSAVSIVQNKFQKPEALRATEKELNETLFELHTRRQELEAFTPSSLGKDYAMMASMTNDPVLKEQLEKQAYQISRQNMQLEQVAKQSLTSTKAEIANKENQLQDVKVKRIQMETKQDTRQDKLHRLMEELDDGKTPLPEILKKAAVLAQGEPVQGHAVSRPDMGR